MWEIWVQSLGQEDPLEKGMLPTPVFMPGESHGQRSLEGYSPWRCKESDITEQLTLSLFFVALFQWVKKELKALFMLLHVNLVYFIWLPHNSPWYAYNIIVLKFFVKDIQSAFYSATTKKNASVENCIHFSFGISVRVTIGRHLEMGSLELENTYTLNFVDYFQMAL